MRSCSQPVVVVRVAKQSTNERPLTGEAVALGAILSGLILSGLVRETGVKMCICGCDRDELWW